MKPGSEESFDFNYASSNAKALIEELVELGFKHYSGSESFILQWRHEPFIFEAHQMVIFGLNNKTNIINYSLKDHLFYYTTPDSEALTRCDPNIKDLESLICLYLK